MSNFPLPPGCRNVCRPNRSGKRGFTPAALRRIVASMLADGYDEGEICDAVWQGGADCACAGAKKVGDYASLLMEGTQRAKLRAAIATIQRIRSWVADIASASSAFSQFVPPGDETATTTPTGWLDVILGRVVSLARWVTKWARVFQAAAQVTEWLDALMAQLDPEADSLQQVIDFANTVCLKGD